MPKAPALVFRSVRASCTRTLGLFVICMAIPSSLCFGQSSMISLGNDSHHTMQLQFGGASYIESFENHQWLARSWGFDQQRSAGSGNLPAFQIRIKTEPSPGSVPGVELSTWNFVSAQELPIVQPDARHAVVELSSTQMPITVKVHTLLDGTAVLTRWLEITNRSTKPIALIGVSPLAGQLWEGSAIADVGYATRAECCWEGWFGWQRLMPGTNRIQQEHGLSFDHPYFLLHNETGGDYFFAELEWPLNRVIEFYNHDGLSFKMGPTAANALRVLAPGETVTSPRLHFGHTKGTFDAAVQAMHDHIRRSVLNPRKPDLAYRIEVVMSEDQPVTVYRGEQYNQANLEKFIDAASQLGMELFILDGPTWCETYGEWLKPQSKEFPNGLGPLVDFAHKHHVLFGLYAEPEGGRDGYTSVNNGLTIGPWKNSAVYQQHPAWFPKAQKTWGPRALGPTDGSGPPVLDLADPAAASYMQSTIEAMVKQYGLDLYRHDFNSPWQDEGLTTESDGFVEAQYWRHYQAFDDVFSRIHRDFPDLILQQASAGGTRMDLGTVARFSENYTSDRVSMPYVYRMLAGYSVYLPPESLIAPVGMALPEERPDLDTMLRSLFALGNTPMVFNSLIPKTAAEITTDIREKFLHYTTLYKRFIRPMLPSVRVYHHAPVTADGGVDSGNWFAMEFGSPDHRQGWALVIRLSPKASPGYLLEPRGLDPSKEYEVTFDSTGAREVENGSQIRQHGLRISLSNDTISELVLFEAKDSQ
jgi:alpha-galactosidase